MFEYCLLEVETLYDMIYQLDFQQFHYIILPKILFLGVIFDFTTQPYTNAFVTSSSI